MRNDSFSIRCQEAHFRNIDRHLSLIHIYALMGERIGMDIVNMIWDRCANAIEAPDYENCKMDVLQTLVMEVPFTEEEFRNEKKEKLADRTFDAAM